MNRILLLLFPVFLSGCVGFAPVPVSGTITYSDGHRYYHDRDRDGVPSRFDRDRDGDGLRNGPDRHPDNRRRY
jgi:hypothetical protein